LRRPKRWHAPGRILPPPVRHQIYRQMSRRSQLLYQCRATVDGVSSRRARESKSARMASSPVRRVIENLQRNVSATNLILRSRVHYAGPPGILGGKNRRHLLKIAPRIRRQAAPEFRAPATGAASGPAACPSASKRVRGIAKAENRGVLLALAPPGIKTSTKRVALPNSKTRTPVARGSRVPDARSAGIRKDADTHPRCRENLTMTAVDDPGRRQNGEGSLWLCAAYYAALRSLLVIRGCIVNSF